MKKIILSTAVAMLIAFTGFSQKEKQETTTFGVRGNCGMCQATIEKAANAVEGVTTANWDVDLKYITVTYNPEKTNVTEIHQAIAASGYDTDKFPASAKAYENLPGCCQYDHEMKMSLKEEYQCPMKCEGDKMYLEAGKCPKCNMDLQKKKEDGHQGHKH